MTLTAPAYASETTTLMDQNRKSPMPISTCLFSRPFAAAGAAILSLTFLASCAELEKVSGEVFGNVDTVEYDCDDDRSFIAEYSKEERVAQVLTDEDDEYTLRLVDREDGSNIYRTRGDDRDATLNVEDDRAELEIDGRDDYDDCEAT